MNARPVFVVQAARGPVLLITIGALFALQQAGIVGFDRTWPLILIVLGIMKLLERMAVPPAATPPFARPPQGQPPYTQPPYTQPPYTQPPYPAPPPPPAPPGVRQ